METGTVKLYNAASGSGIISLSGSGQEIQVTSTGLREAIRSGDRVVFEVSEGSRGPVAVNVRLA